jgi:hypothetical protein
VREGVARPNEVPAPMRPVTTRVDPMAKRFARSGLGVGSPRLPDHILRGKLVGLCGSSSGSRSQSWTNVGETRWDD